MANLSTRRSWKQFFKKKYDETILHNTSRDVSRFIDILKIYKNLVDNEKRTLETIEKVSLFSNILNV